MNKYARVCLTQACTLLLTAVLSLSSFHGYSQQLLRVESKNQPLRAVFEQIERQAGYSFLYDASLIHTDKRLSITLQGTLQQVLQQLEDHLGLDMEIAGRNILVAKSAVAQLSGRIVDEAGQPLPYVSVFLKELNQYYVTDKQGNFQFKYATQRLKDAHLTVSMIGRQGKTVDVDLRGGSKTLPAISLPLLSVGLEEIAVAPQVNKNLESNSSLYINREVIEQSGALSLNDLLNLVPGQKIAPPSLQQVQQANLRGASLSTGNSHTRDAFSLNNSFGVAVIMDGIALSNNANMQTRNPGLDGMGSSYVFGASSGLYGSDNRLSNYTGDYTFGGTDLRQIAVDNIDNIEVIAGISSAKYGDMTNGAIVINRMAGYTPFTFNVQLRDNATSYGLNKGFQTAKLGAFTIGGNFTRSFQDNRDKLKSYDRIGTNLMWTTSAGVNRAFTNTFAVDYGKNLDRVLVDPDDPTASMVRFKSSNFSASNRTNYRVENSFLTNIGLNLRYSQNYQNTYKEEHKNGAFVVYTDATETGVTEGTYAPGIYTAVTNIEGKPIDFSARFDLTGAYATGSIMHTLTFGSNFNYSKNMGRGQLIDPTRPRQNTWTSTGSSKSERYYDFSMIHAQQQLGFYVEDVFTAYLADKPLNVRVGSRMDLFERYLTASPRANLNYEITPDLRLGLAYGFGSKAPALAQLYPGPLFYEIPLFQYTAVNDNGAIDEANSLYLLYVDRYMPDNSNLKPSSSQQLEFSVAYAKRGFKWNINIYDKRTFGDIATRVDYETIFLDHYTANPDAAAELPYIIDGEKQYRLTRRTFANGRKTVNNGVELLLSTPKWDAIQTSFNIRGGITRSTYYPLEGTSNQQIFTNPGTDPGYATVGIYPLLARTTWSSNAALTSSTHIPSAKLLINFVSEFNILNKTNTSERDGIPIGYYTADGTYFPINTFDESNANYAHLLRPLELINNQNQPGVYTNFHLNISKEISKRLTLAFNVYNVFNYRPQYVRSDNTLIIPNSKPTYGAQLRLKL
ncbi:TonB-dependent receptor domain-containing protein [Sphingobacterium bambusae]|uniref:TonB-dependent receptor domain-containing protein n=1 Tax=Sphingobacterium bambusae TaxID=662858 RepID=A0ABW6BMU6_9SPHI|nr:TonB-dependent receptor [Sphingobacterium bambusae]WPL48102.1 TonB-dependent receptor [Sphingobacterium bambusae]